MSEPIPQELALVYSNRFDATQAYRREVWGVLISDFFQALLPPGATLLDLGCGYGEFVNQVEAAKKYGMDLNPNTASHLDRNVQFLAQDCSKQWELPDSTLDVVFTSNFFEHLPDKIALGRTLDEAFRCLKPGGQLIALGPNIKYTGGSYWDFWDHYLPLTEASLSEALKTRGFEITRCEPRFLPYTMAKGPQYPMWMLGLYLRLPLLWRVKGQQFLVVARKRAA